MPPNAVWCAEPGATFVTLRWSNGELQGCIGSLEAVRAIVDDVAHNAVAACTRDPRGMPVTHDNIDQLDVDLSMLSPLEPIAFRDETSALAAIRVAIDGIVLIHRMRRATFLSVVWEAFPTATAFIGELKRKGGLPREFWSDDIRLLRYTTVRCVDPAPRQRTPGHSASEPRGHA